MIWFSGSDLANLADERSYERGLDYVTAVGGLAELPGGVVATVQGEALYRVRLSGAGDGVLAGECSCPYGQGGAFCKHCVAVGLRLLADAEGAPPKPDRAAGDVRGFLRDLPPAALVDLVWDLAAEDPELFARLRLLAATATDRPDLALLARRIDGLHADRLEYGTSRAYAADARMVLEALRRLMPVHAEALQPLLRKAIAVISAAAAVNEDDGPEVLDVAVGAWETLLAACDVAPPDPVELAGWFAGLQLGGANVLGLSVEEIAGRLGERGLAEYRHRIAVPGAPPALLDQLLLATGDVDALVARWAEDLSGPYQYLRIAELLRDRERPAEAVMWAERGIAAAGDELDHRHTRLIDLLAGLYAGAGRDADVLALREQHFMAAGTGPEYRVLKAVAEPAGAWSHLRPRAHARLRERAEAGAWGAADTLVTVLADEGERAAAWDAVQRFRCGEPTLLAVAGWRAETHPEDAVALYRPMVDAAIARTNQEGYAHATQLLLRIRALSPDAGFAADLAALKQAHHRKRNLLAELSRHGL